MELIFSKFGFDFDRESLKLNWGALKAARDAYILRLNGIYDRMLGNSKVTIIRGAAKFSGPNAVSIGEKGVPTTSLSTINIIFFNINLSFQYSQQIISWWLSEVALPCRTSKGRSSASPRTASSHWTNSPRYPTDGRPYIINCYWLLILVVWFAGSGWRWWAADTSAWSWRGCSTPWAPTPSTSPARTDR